MGRGRGGGWRRGSLGVGRDWKRGVLGHRLCSSCLEGRGVVLEGLTGQILGVLGEILNGVDFGLGIVDILLIMLISIENYSGINSSMHIITGRSPNIEPIAIIIALKTLIAGIPNWCIVKISHMPMHCFLLNKTIPRL